MNFKLLTIPLAIAMAILFSMAFTLHAEANSEVYKNWR